MAMETTVNKSFFEEKLMNAVRASISKSLEEECNKAIEEAKNKVQDSVAELVSSISLRIMKEVSFEYFGDKLAIYVTMKTN